jgi:Mrp family chromosome partitioning ATPase
MRIKLLIASTENDYTGHMSNRILEHHVDAIDVTICSSPELLAEQLSAKKFDVALLEESFIEAADLSGIHLPILLWSEDENAVDAGTELIKIRKYQKVSSIVAEVLEKYAKVSTDRRFSDPDKAMITAVWSPSGGVGKTSVALAYAAKKALEGKQVLYLSLELFSSIPVYFNENGKSISAIFEMLENHDGNVRVLTQGIRRRDDDTGIAYFCRPENFDDMNILTTENVTELVEACSGITEELVIDMSCLCDERAQQVFEYADRALIVTDASKTAQTKLLQFTAQHHVFERIKDKAFLVANKGAVINNQFTDTIIMLPLVKSVDASTVYKTLSGCSFEI